MPPRHAYWTILVDDQPTAFRAADRDDLQPTFKRLQEKHPSARMVWFQNGKIWTSRLEAQEAMKFRGERGRAGDIRQRVAPGVSRGRTESRQKLEWKPKGAAPDRPKLEWKPKAAPGSARPTTQDPRPRTQDPRPRRDSKWRPGGEHRDPRQKYKDAKKAKWTRFKQNVRRRWEAKQDHKKKDEE
jgi:hypothetical protein